MSNATQRKPGAPSSDAHDARDHLENRDWGRHAVARYMSSSPHSIGQDQPLEAASSMMRLHHIRHLPVLDGGKLAGVLSQRDIYFVESIAGVDPASVPVQEAMTQETYCVPPTTRLEEVVAEMASQKYGCAVIMEGDRVEGIFTTTDALRILSDMLMNPEAAR